MNLIKGSLTFNLARPRFLINLFFYFFIIFNKFFSAQLLLKIFPKTKHYLRVYIAFLINWLSFVCRYTKDVFPTRNKITANLIWSIGLYFLFLKINRNRRPSNWLKFPVVSIKGWKTFWLICQPFISTSVSVVRVTCVTINRKKSLK